MEKKKESGLWDSRVRVLGLASPCGGQRQSSEGRALAWLGESWVMLAMSGLSFRSPNAMDAQERNVWMLVRLSASELQRRVGVSRLMSGVSDSGIVRRLGRGRCAEGV